MIERQRISKIPRASEYRRRENKARANGTHGTSVRNANANAKRGDASGAGGRIVVGGNAENMTPKRSTAGVRRTSMYARCRSSLNHLTSTLLLNRPRYNRTKWMFLQYTAAKRDNSRNTEIKNPDRVSAARDWETKGCSMDSFMRVMKQRAPRVVCVHRVTCRDITMSGKSRILYETARLRDAEHKRWSKVNTKSSKNLQFSCEHASAFHCVDDKILITTFAHQSRIKLPLLLRFCQ